MSSENESGVPNHFKTSKILEGNERKNTEYTCTCNFLFLFYTVNIKREGYILCFSLKLSFDLFGKGAMYIICLSVDKNGKNVQ